MRGECIDFDECNKHNGFCHENVHCINTVGSYICGCRSGYEFFTKINWDLYINEPYCVDIDECRNRVVCPKKSICKNTDGSYICQCNPGFVGHLCEDIDECNLTSTCDENATCFNKEGSYVCSCNLGYRGDGLTCKVGQCEDRRCPPDQKCISPTTDKCQCNEGLSYNTITEFCEDDDECLLDHDCGRNSTCVNIKGSFTCDCNPGYIGDGKTCVKGTCTDDMCPTNAECVTPSKPDCRCINGFELKLLKSNQTDISDHICVDTDECSTPKGICHDKAVCSNSEGGYECNCQDGYFGDGQTCFPGYCSDSNCPPSDHKECVSRRSNLCKCIEGYHFNNLSVCVDIDECKPEPCDQNASCANLPGNFSCTCSFGYHGDGVSCSKKAVLVLNPFSFEWDIAFNAILVDAKSRNDRIRLSKGENTEVEFSCSVTFHNRFYVFGGDRQSRQISEVTECGLKRIGTLHFDHVSGTCSNVDDREIYLCFDSRHLRQCRSGVDPNGDFINFTAPPSTFNHYRSRTSASSSQF